MRENRDWAMLVVLCAAALLGGTLEVLFIPLYVGSVIFPVVAVFAVAGNVLLPVLGRNLVATEAGALAPLLCWLLPVLGLSLVVRPEGDVLVAGAGGQQYVFYAVLFGGCLAGVLTVVLLRPAPRPRQPQPTPQRRPPTR